MFMVPFSSCSTCGALLVVIQEHANARKKAMTGDAAVMYLKGVC